MNSLFCYCCQGLLNISPKNNKGKPVTWKIIYKIPCSFIENPMLISILSDVNKFYQV